MQRNQLQPSLPVECPFFSMVPDGTRSKHVALRFPQLPSGCNHLEEVLLTKRPGTVHRDRPSIPNAPSRCHRCHRCTDAPCTQCRDGAETRRPWQNTGEKRWGNGDCMGVIGMIQLFNKENVIWMWMCRKVKKKRGLQHFTRWCSVSVLKRKNVTGKTSDWTPLLQAAQVWIRWTEQKGDEAEKVLAIDAGFHSHGTPLKKLGWFGGGTPMTQETALNSQIISSWEVSEKVGEKDCFPKKRLAKGKQPRRLNAWGLQHVSFGQLICSLSSICMYKTNHNSPTKNAWWPRHWVFQFLW